MRARSAWHLGIRRERNSSVLSMLLLSGTRSVGSHHYLKRHTPSWLIIRRQSSLVGCTWLALQFSQLFRTGCADHSLLKQHGNTPSFSQRLGISLNCCSGWKINDSLCTLAWTLLL